MRNLIIENAKLVLSDGAVVYGPVTTEDHQEFLFRNTYSELDLYFLLKKDEDGNWFFSGGPSIEIPKNYVGQIGDQIDNK